MIDEKPFCNRSRTMQPIINKNCVVYKQSHAPQWQIVSCKCASVQVKNINKIVISYSVNIKCSHNDQQRRMFHSSIILYKHAYYNYATKCVIKYKLVPHYTHLVSKVKHLTLLIFHNLIAGPDVQYSRFSAISKDLFFYSEKNVGENI